MLCGSLKKRIRMRATRSPQRDGGYRPSKSMRPRHFIGPNGRVRCSTLLRAVEQLIAYYHMWFTGEPAAEQCEGCTFVSSQVRELSYLHARNITYAVLCWGPYDESVRYRDFMQYGVPWYSVAESADVLRAGRTFNRFMLVSYLRQGNKVFETYWTSGRGIEVVTPTLGLLDMTVYGRQEPWENSPAGWPQPDPGWRENGRPTSQWSRIEAGYSDDLGQS